MERTKHTDAATVWVIVIESFLDFEKPLSVFSHVAPPSCDPSPLSTFLIRSATKTLLRIHLHIVFSRPLRSYPSACRPRALRVHPSVSRFPPEPPGNTFVLVFRSPPASAACSWRSVLRARRSLCVHLVFQHACFSVFTVAALLLTPVASASHLSVPLHIDFFDSVSSSRSYLIKPLKFPCVPTISWSPTSDTQVRSDPLAG